MTRARIFSLRVAALMAGVSIAAHGQLANASTAATGLGGAFTARAQGYNAVFWNPANLAMPGNPGFSLGLLPVDVQAGLKPIDLNRIAEFSGIDVPKAAREQWMLDVERDGGQKGAVGAGVTGLGLSLGPIGFQLATKVSSDMNLAPGAVEAMLFGNAGRYDSVRTLSLAGSDFTAAAYTTAAVSYGMSLPGVPLTDFAVGVTAKYTMGHGLVAGMDNGSGLSTTDVRVDFPAVLPDTKTLESLNAGSGFGMDIGAAWKTPGFRFGASFQNVFNTFKWDTTRFASRSAVGLFNSDTNYFEADTLDKPYAAAPAALRERVAAQRFKPVISGGVSFDWIPRITVSADVRQQFGEGIEIGPASMVGAGAELRLIPFIPLRGGVQMMSGGFGVSGGFGLHFVGFEAGLAGYLRKRDGGSETGFTLALFSIKP